MSKTRATARRSVRWPYRRRNRTSANQAGASAQTYTWTYDAAGNQTRNGLTGTTSTFGDRGQLTALGSNNRSYFGTGNTDRLSQGSVTFNNGALGLMQSISGSTVDNFTRTPSGDAVGRVPGVDHSHAYYIQDHLGSVVGLFDSAGSFKGGYSYSPYGEARFTSTNAAVTANPLRYIGEHHDGNGIYKLGARYYDTSLGRFTQMDPSGQEANPYAYAGCNPINNTDPTGREWGDADCSLAFGSLIASVILFEINLAIAVIGAIPSGGVIPALTSGLLIAEAALIAASAIGAAWSCN